MAEEELDKLKREVEVGLGKIQALQLILGLHLSSFLAPNMPTRRGRKPDIVEIAHSIRSKITESRRELASFGHDNLIEGFDMVILTFDPLLQAASQLEDS